MSLRLYCVGDTWSSVREPTHSQAQRVAGHLLPEGRATAHQLLPERLANASEIPFSHIHPPRAQHGGAHTSFVSTDTSSRPQGPACIRLLPPFRSATAETHGLCTTSTHLLPRCARVHPAHTRTTWNLLPGVLPGNRGSPGILASKRAIVLEAYVEIPYLWFPHLINTVAMLRRTLSGYGRVASGLPAGHDLGGSRQFASRCYRSELQGN